MPHHVFGRVPADRFWNGSGGAATTLGTVNTDATARSATAIAFSDADAAGRGKQHMTGGKCCAMGCTAPQAAAVPWARSRVLQPGIGTAFMALMRSTKRRH